jgi:dTDP-glucose 4,6-dehydratase
MTRVLVTGAGGFAGHHFLEHALVNTDWDIVATDSFRHKGKTDRITEVLMQHDAVPEHELATSALWLNRVQVLTHDLTVPFSEQAIERLGQIDYIVAYASESHVDRSISDPVPFIRNNVDVALSTLELARRLSPKALVWVSTDEVYGPVEATDLKGHPEWDTILPSNPYAASKAAQEDLAISYWRTYDVPLIIVNCMNMIGERQDPEKFVPLVIGKVLSGETVPIHAQGAEIGTRHYLHARNLADGIMFLLEKVYGPAMFSGNWPAAAAKIPVGASVAIPPLEDRPDRYNIATPDRIDNLTLAQMIADFAGKRLSYQFQDFHSTRPGHDPHYGLDPSKMESLGWKPPITLAASLKQTVEWTMRNRNWLIAD